MVKVSPVLTGAVASYLFHEPAPFAFGSAPSVTAANSGTRALANQVSVLFFNWKPTASFVASHDD